MNVSLLLLLVSHGRQNVLPSRCELLLADGHGTQVRNEVCRGKEQKEDKGIQRW